MTVLNETIRLRAPTNLVDMASAWARSRGETVSGMIRRLLAQEVPGLGEGEAEATPPPAADLLASVLAGEDGAAGKLLFAVRDGSPEERQALLVALAGYLVWEYSAPPDSENVHEIILETERILRDGIIYAGDGDA